MQRSDYRRYDHRLKNLVAASDDIKKFEAYGISQGPFENVRKKDFVSFLRKKIVSRKIKPLSEIFPPTPAGMNLNQ